MAACALHCRMPWSALCGNFRDVTAKRIAVLPGDGIGREVVPQALRVIEATGAPVHFTDFDWGADRYLADGETVPPDGFAMLARDFDAIFVGAFGDPRVTTNIQPKKSSLACVSRWIYTPMSARCACSTRRFVR